VQANDSGSGSLQFLQEFLPHQQPEFTPSLDPFLGFTSSGQLSDTHVSDWQSPFDSVPFENLSSFDTASTYDDILLPLIPPSDYDTSNLDNMAFNENDTLTDDLLLMHPILSPHSSPSSLSKSSPEDTTSKSGSASVSSKSREEKRKANTLAARRYRQNRLDKMTELEEALKEVQRERDALKVKVAKLEGENQVLKDLVRGG